MSPKKVYYEDEEINYIKLSKKKKVKDRLWEDYKSLNTDNGYTPYEAEDYYLDELENEEGDA